MNSSAEGVEFSQTLNMIEPFAINPFAVSNAKIYQETFAPNVRYWGPTTPNVEGSVTFKFDVPFAVEHASIVAGVTSYTVGSDANFDSNAATYLDVSTDNANWTTVASQTNANAVFSGISGPWDLSSLVSGSNIVYIRARMFMTTSYFFSPSQFLRQGAPYGGGLFTASAADTPAGKVFQQLDFNAPVANTITDVNGLGTGFTHRLPGTGGGRPVNDPNIDLNWAPGKLRLTSTRADVNQAYPGPAGLNLPNLETLGIYVPNIGSKDIEVKATIEGVHVLNSSDQIAIWAGADANTILRAGVHDSNQFIMSPNSGAGDMNTATPGNAFTTGDDIELILARRGGLWSLSWHNLTTQTNGALPGVSLPWLDAQPNLYFGVLAANARNNQPFIATFDNFSVCVVPEPAGLTIAATLGAGVIVVRKRRFSGGRRHERRSCFAPRAARLESRHEHHC